MSLGSGALDGRRRAKTKGRVGRKPKKTSDQAIRMAQKKAEALNYRMSGWSFAQIGEAMELTRQRAHQLVLAALEETVQEPADAVRKLELARLDEMMPKLFEMATAGDIRSIEAVLKISERRARIMGIDAPSQVEVAGKGGAPLAPPVIQFVRDADPA